MDEAYRTGSLTGLATRDVLRVLALLAREGRLPDEPPPGRPHDLLRAVLGNLPWDLSLLERDVAWLHALPGDGIEALHLGCCLRPSEAAALLPPEALQALLEGLRARCLPPTAVEERSVALWETHAQRLLAAAAGEAWPPGATPASEAGLELAAWRGTPPEAARREGARRSLAREATMWDGGSRLLQALRWMESLPPEEQADLLWEKRDLLLRGPRGDGEPGLLLALRSPVAAGVARFWRRALAEEPELLSSVRGSVGGELL